MLHTGAGIKGLCACLLQEDKPVYFTSKALTDAQRGYVAIGIEPLAVAWTMEKFHHILYDSHFILETDQKLFEAILLKSLNQATPRLGQMMIRTFAYNFTVRYIPGVTNKLPDCVCPDKVVKNIPSSYQSCTYSSNYKSTECRK